MLLSYNWLKYYVDLPDSFTAEELALKLTMSTVEVEGVEKLGNDLEKIVVGKVIAEEKHPDADKLKLCKVDVGPSTFRQAQGGEQSRTTSSGQVNEVLQVVCGGSNVKEGMLVALGKVGAKVKWHGEGELIELKPTKIRGIESFGMICASTEIGLGEMFPLKDEKEILDLTELKVEVGSPIDGALGLNDAIFDIDNKSMTHRPDLWGHYGMAREVAALYNKQLKEYKVPEIQEGKEVKLNVQVENTKLCPRYMAVAIAGIKIGPSPQWMQSLLLAVGLRPINNIVDITNFVMYDLGQPMHAFDKRNLVGDKIIVRPAKKGEKFITLDEAEHKLCEDDIVIADSGKAVALGGIMGGLNSQIKNDTTAIVFESANFDATTIRKTALRLGMRTDSSARFEKALDPNNAEIALKRAVELTLKMCPEAKVVSKVIDKSNFHLSQGPIELSLELLKLKIGVDIEKKQVIKILESLGFEIKEKKDALMVTVPTWRATRDISIVEDLVEEVARIYGYNNIEVQLPKFPIVPPKRNLLRDLERQAKDVICMECGFTEIYNYSFVSPELLKKIGMGTEDLIELDNPIAKDRPFLRHNLWPNLLENVEKNQRQTDVLKLFEIGKVFRKEQSGLRIAENSDELLPRQDTLLCLVCAGKNIEVPFYEVGEAFKNLMKHFNVEVEFKAHEKVEDAFVHAGRQAVVYVNDKAVGAIAELHPATQKNIGLESRVGMLEINLDELLPVLNEEKKYSPLSLYPGVVRDIAFVVDKSITHAEIVKALTKVDPLIVSVELFDVYLPSASAQGKGKNLGENKKSMAYHLTYLSAERTLTAEEVDKIQEKVIKKIEKEFNGEVRR